MATDFSKLADEELRRWIAERLGWHAVAEGNGYGVPGYAMYRNEDDFYFWAKGEELVWRAAMSDESGLPIIPNWPGSVDDALTLTRGKARLRIAVTDDKAVAAMDIGMRTYRGKAAPDRLARAISEAWAMMMEAETK